MLVKKTIVMSGKGGQGHLTAVRVGNETGLKLVMEPPAARAVLAFKAGNSPESFYEVSSSKSEIPVNIALDAHDELSAAVFTAEGEYLSGGRKRKFSVPKEYFEPEKVKRAANSRETKEEGTAPKSEESSAPESAEEEGGKVNYPDSETLKDRGDDADAGHSGMSEKTLKDDGESDGAKAQNLVQAENTAQYSEEVDTIKTDESVTEKTKKVTRNEKNEDEELDLGKAFGSFQFNKGENFYLNIRGKLEEIMTINPECRELEKLIPDSKWVKVYYDEDEYYVVGILTEEGAVRYLGYGVPGVEGIRPPKEAEELCDFLPSGGEEEGYWIMLQKADNGELIK